MKHFTLVVIVALLAACNTVPKSDYSGDLKIGQILEGTLEQESSDTFALSLPAETFVYGVVQQTGLDVAVQVLDSAGLVLGYFDGPVKGVPEIFHFESEEAGNFLLLVKPFEKQSGAYSIELRVVEPIATEPGKRADQLFMPYSGGGSPGGVIGVIENGKVIFSRAYGLANLTHGLPFEIHTPTNIGSVSKQFTATAILLLEQDGKLSLEDDVRKYIPELPDLGQVVRIKNLLNHTNGYREVYNLMPMTGWKGEDVLLRKTVLEILQKQEALQAAPGEVFNYNNSAYILAARIVELISGMPFPQFMEERVFGPLGMESSVVRASPNVIIPGASQGYTADSTGYHESADLAGSYGAGAIYTTVQDFARWMGNFADAELGGTQLVERLTTPDTLNNGDTMTYALGLDIGEVNGLKAWSHGGADLAHRAYMVYFPEIKGGAVAMGNNAGFNPYRIANEMAEIFFAEHIEIDEEASGEEDKGEEGEGEAKKEADKVEVTEQTLREYAGDYLIKGVGYKLSFSYKDDMLKLITEGQPETAMIPLSQTKFRYEAIEAWIEFRRDESGKVTGAVHTQGGGDFELERVPPYDPEPEVLADYAGRYFSEELETFYHLEVQDTLLVVKIRNCEDIKLEPLKEDLYKGSVTFLGEIQFTREDGELTGFEASNGRTKGIRFDRIR